MICQLMIRVMPIVTFHVLLHGPVIVNVHVYVMSIAVVTHDFDFGVVTVGAPLVSVNDDRREIDFGVIVSGYVTGAFHVIDYVHRIFDDVRRICFGARQICCGVRQICFGDRQTCSDGDDHLLIEIFVAD